MNICAYSQTQDIFPTFCNHLAKPYLNENIAFCFTIAGFPGSQGILPFYDLHFCRLKKEADGHGYKVGFT